jgi:hypothetical protein
VELELLPDELLPDELLLDDELLLLHAARDSAPAQTTARIPERAIL